MLVGWVRIPVGSTEDMTNGTCGLSCLLFPHGAAIGSGAMGRIHCKFPRGPQCMQSSGDGHPLTTRYTPKRVQTSIMKLSFLLVANFINDKIDFRLKSNIYIYTKFGKESQTKTN